MDPWDQRRKFPGTNWDTLRWRRCVSSFPVSVPMQPREIQTTVPGTNWDELIVVRLAMSEFRHKLECEFVVHCRKVVFGYHCHRAAVFACLAALSRQRRTQQHLPPATLRRMELSIVHKRCATQWTRQRIPDFACRNRLVHGHEQDTIVGHDVAERCRCPQPIQASATRQRRTAQDCPGWITISSTRCVCHRCFLVHGSRRRSEGLVRSITSKPSSVMPCGLLIALPHRPLHALLQLLSDGRVRDAEIAFCQGSVSSRFVDVFWPRFGGQCASAAVRHADDE